LLTGQATHEDLSRFASPPNPSHLDPIPIADRSHAIQGVFGRYWEWTHRELRKPVQMNGAVDFSNSGEQLSRRQKVVIGSSQSHGFDHLFDCYYGINDHFQEMQGLQLHLETDQQTAYLNSKPLSANRNQPFALLFAMQSSHRDAMEEMAGARMPTDRTIVSGPTYSDAVLRLDVAVAIT
jgi:hypothetical protein